MFRGFIKNPDDPKDQSVIMGLSEGNINRLKNGQPIVETFDSFGFKHPGKIICFWGPTEKHIEADLRRLGFIPESVNKVPTDEKLLAESKIMAENGHILILTVGLPRSGKSTWARQQCWPIVNPDSIRLRLTGQEFVPQAEGFVWSIAHTMVESLFLAGHKIVILDATNVTKKRREEWKCRLDSSVKWTTAYRLFNTQKDECLRRAKENNASEGLLAAIERMSSQIEQLEEKDVVWPV